jgi:polyphosphate kinase 2 (PPK2 family)
MKYVDRFRVKPGSHVQLADIDPGFRDDRESHKKASEEIEQDQEKLRALQDLFYADRRFSLLICLQALDTGGKKQPSAEELAHDFLWRAHRATPRRG